MLKAEVEGLEGMIKDLAEDSLMKELDLANAIDTKAAAEELFRVKLAAYQTHRTALDEEHHKAIAAIEEEDAKDEVIVLNLLKQVEELRERQKSRSVECKQKKELQEKELEQKHEGTESIAMSRYKTAKNEVQEKEESARLAKVDTLTVDRNLTEKKAEIERMGKHLNERKEVASSQNSRGGGVAQIAPKNLALANQDYNELKRDLLHHMDDNDIATVLRAILNNEDLRSFFLKFVKNTGIVHNEHFPDDPKIKISRRKRGTTIIECHSQWMERIVGYFTTAPEVITVENEATAKSFEGQQPSLDAAAQSRKKTLFFF